MAKKEIVIYICDVCGEESEDSTFLRTDTIPCYFGEQNESYSESPIELCPSCAKKLREVIRDNFAYVSNYYGLDIKPVK